MAAQIMLHKQGSRWGRPGMPAVEIGLLFPHLRHGDVTIHILGFHPVAKCRDGNADV